MGAQRRLRATTTRRQRTLRGRHGARSGASWLLAACLWRGAAYEQFSRRRSADPRAAPRRPCSCICLQDAQLGAATVTRGSKAARPGAGSTRGGREHRAARRPCMRRAYRRGVPCGAGGGGGGADGRAQRRHSGRRSSKRAAAALAIRDALRRRAASGLLLRRWAIHSRPPRANAEHGLEPDATARCGGGGGARDDGCGQALTFSLPTCTSPL